MPGVGCGARSWAWLAVAAFLSTAASASHAFAGGKPAAEEAHAPAHAGPPEPPPEPLAWRKPPAPLFTVRPLAPLRERLVRGSDDDPQGQVAVIGAVGDELAQFDASVWQDARNRHALVSYTLGGGDPSLLRKVAEADLFSEQEKPLGHGSLAYAEGHFEAAAELLGKIDVQALPASLAGRVALVKAVVLARSDANAALEMCRLARAVSPGTIVDEAALRMTIEVAAASGNSVAFRHGIDRLMWRFPRTPFLSSILGQIASYVASRDEFSEPDAVVWIENTAAALTPVQRVALIEQIADGALRAGRYRLLLEATRIGLKDVTGDVGNRLKAYSAAAIAVGAENAQGLAIAREVAKTQLPAKLDETLRMASMLGEMIAAPPTLLDAPQGEGSAGDVAPADVADPSPQEAAWMAGFRNRVSMIDRAVEETSK